MPILTTVQWKIIKQTLLLLSLSAVANSVFAGPCGDDIGLLCADAKGQGDRKVVMQCLQEHKAELSSSCAEALDSRTARAEGQGGKSKGAGACRDAVREYCSEARAGGREAIVSCLQSHDSDLSAECRDQVERMGRAKQRIDASLRRSIGA